MWVGFICLESARWGKTWILREFLEVIWFISLLFSCGLQFLLIVSIEIFSPVIVFHFHEPTFKSAFFFSWQLKMYVWFFFAHCCILFSLSIWNWLCQKLQLFHLFSFSPRPKKKFRVLAFLSFLLHLSFLPCFLRAGVILS